MEEVYIITLKVESYFSDESKNVEDTEVIGVTDTERRGLCYLRRFLEESSKYCEYKGQVLTTTEEKCGVVFAEAKRHYGDDSETTYETLIMRKMQLNNMRSPSEEIIDYYF